MIFSKQQLLSEDQAVTATAISENVIDLGVAGTPHGAAAALNRDIGKGNRVPFLAQVTEDFATLTSLTVTIETSANSDLTSSTVLYSSGAIAAADLVAGYQIPMPILPEGLTGRYVGARYTVVGPSATAGKIQAGVTMGNQSNVTGA